MFGAGPVTGGQAGGKDYSLASMLGKATPHDSAERDGKQRVGEAEASKGAGREDRLGDRGLSSGAQDLLKGAGVMQGAKGGGQQPSWAQGGPTQGSQQGLSPEEQISGKEELSAMQESTLRGLQGMDTKDPSDHRSGDAPGHTDPDDEFPAAGEGQAAGVQEGGNAMASPGKASITKPLPDVQGTLPQRKDGEARSSGATDEGTRGWSAEGAQPELGPAGVLSKDDSSMLRGQGILSSSDEEHPQGVVPARSPAAEAADNEADELQKEQSEVPEEEFSKQPAGGGALAEGAQAAWDAAAQVAGKAKGLVRGQGQ